MIKSKILISLSSLTALGLGIFYYNHLRLISLYPTLPVPNQLLISNRADKPFTTEKWARCDAGDSWAVKIPKAQLITSQPLISSTNQNGDSGLQWNKSFWASWALRLEGGLFGLVKNVFGIRYNEQYERMDFDMDMGGWEKGRNLLNGLFTIESIDQIPLEPSNPTNATASQAIYRWRILTTGINSKILVRGGYHTLSILPSALLINPPTSITNPSTQNYSENEEDIYLIFSAEGLYRHPFTIKDGERIKRSTELVEGMNILDKVFAEFHREYSRILIDLAVRGMGLEGKVGRVDKWPEGAI